MNIRHITPIIAICCSSLFAEQMSEDQIFATYNKTLVLQQDILTVLKDIQTEESSKEAANKISGIIKEANELFTVLNENNFGETPKAQELIKSSLPETLAIIDRIIGERRRLELEDLMSDELQSAISVFPVDSKDRIDYEVFNMTEESALKLAQEDAALDEELLSILKAINNPESSNKSIIRIDAIIQRQQFIFQVLKHCGLFTNDDQDIKLVEDKILELRPKIYVEVKRIHTEGLMSDKLKKVLAPAYSPQQTEIEKIKAGENEYLALSSEFASLLSEINDNDSARAGAKKIAHLTIKIADYCASRTADDLMKLSKQELKEISLKETPIIEKINAEIDRIKNSNVISDELKRMLGVLDQDTPFYKHNE